MNNSKVTIFKKAPDVSDERFSLLFDEYYEPLCFFANKYIKDLDTSRSLVQQLFVDLWVKRDQLNVHSSVKSYLYNAAKNKAIDHLRTLKVNIELSESHENENHLPFHDLIEEAELNNRINTAINNLPEKCREVFVLCRFHGLKYAEIAEKLDISVKTVEMQISIALKKLRSNLADY